MRVELERQLAPYRERHRHVRWTRPDSWHLTLLFLGSVEPPRAAELHAAVEHLAAEWGPYRVSAAAGGGRVSRGEGVGWLSLDEGAGTLVELAEALAARCPIDVTLGRPPRRTPSAHLTVARRADQALVDALRTQSHGPLSVSWRVDRIALVRSHLGRDGARYETLHQVPL